MKLFLNILATIGFIWIAGNFHYAISMFYALGQEDNRLLIRLVVLIAFEILIIWRLWA